MKKIFIFLGVILIYTLTRSYIIQASEISLPYQGVEDGTTYNEPVRIIYDEGATASLNGDVIANNYLVSLNGDYNLVVTDINGDIYEATFTIHDNLEPELIGLTDGGVYNWVVLPNSDLITYSYSGRTEQPYDSNYYTFTVREEGTYTFYTDAEYDSYGYLYDINGNEIARNDDGGDWLNFRIQYLLSPGTYKLQVAGFWSSYGNYRLYTQGTHPLSNVEISTPGNYSIHLTDNNGNPSNYNFTIDSAATTGVNVVSNGSRNNDVTLVLLENTTATFNGEAINGGYVFTAEGEYQLFITDENLTEHTINFTIDKIAPQIEAQDLTYVVNSDEPNWREVISVTDDHDLAPKINYDENVTMNQIGSYTVRYTVIDKAGNSTTEIINVYVVDSEQPYLGIEQLESMTSNPTFYRDLIEEGFVTKQQIENLVTWARNYGLTSEHLENAILQYADSSLYLLVPTVRDDNNLRITTNNHIIFSTSYHRVWSYDLELDSYSYSYHDYNMIGHIYFLNYNYYLMPYNITHNIRVENQGYTYNGHTYRNGDTINTQHENISYHSRYLTPYEPFIISVGEAYTYPNYIAIDNNDGDITDQVIITGDVDTLNPGIYPVTYSVTNSEGILNEITYYVYVVETVNYDEPMINGMENLTVEVGSSEEEINQMLNVFAVDMSDGPLPITINYDHVNLNEVGEYTIFYETVDSDGHVVTQSSMISVVDTTKPTIHTTEPIIIEVGSSNIDWLSYMNARDNYDTNLTISYDAHLVDLNRVGTYSIKFIATDDYLNKTIKRAEVYVVDQDQPYLDIQPPELNNSNPIFYTNLIEEGFVTEQQIDDLITWAKSRGLTQTQLERAMLIYFDSNDSLYLAVPQSDYLVLFSDGYIGTNDNRDPFESYYYNPSYGYKYFENIIGYSMASHFMPYDYIYNISVDDPSGYRYDGHTYTQGEIFNTQNENLSYHSYYVDSNQPVIIPVGAEYSYPDYKALDLIDGDITDQVIITGDVDTSNPGIYQVTYSVTDSDGNMTEFTYYVYVVETINLNEPMINGVEDITAEVGSSEVSINNLLNVFVVDFTDGELPITINYDDVNLNEVGEYTIIYEAVDSDGHIVTKTGTLFIVDTTAPEVTIPESLTLQANQSVPNWLDYISATDNYDQDLTITIDSNVDLTVLGDYTVTYTVVDDYNNTTIETITVYVVDTTKPVITLNGDEIIYLEYLDAYTEYGATFTDNFDTEGTLTIGGDVVDTSILRTYTITYNITDSNGNVADEVTRTVIVQDNTKPVITLNGDEIIYLKYLDTYTELGATFTDNYDTEGTVIIGGDVVNTNVVGSYTVTYNITDSNGNIADEVTRTVIVQDTTSPTIDVNGLIIVEVGNSEIDWLDFITADDNYDEDVTIETDLSLVNLNNIGSYLITYTAIDDSLNETTVTTKVYVVDSEEPYLELDVEQQEPVTTNPIFYTDLIEAGFVSQQQVDDLINWAKTQGLTQTQLDHALLIYVNNDVWHRLYLSVPTPLGDNYLIIDSDQLVDHSTGAQNDWYYDFETGYGYADNYHAFCNISSIQNTVFIMPYKNIYNISVETSSGFTYDGDSYSHGDIVNTQQENISYYLLYLNHSSNKHFAVIPVGGEYTYPDYIAVDLVDGDITDQVIITGNIDTSKPGIYPVTYSVTDSDGNTTEITYYVYVVESVNPNEPMLNGVEDIIAEVHSTEEQIRDMINVFAIDMSDGPLPFTINFDNVIFNEVGEYTITYEVIDSDGHIVTETSFISIVDTTSPEITLQESLTVDVHHREPNWLDYISAVDNYDIDLTITFDSNVDVSVVGEYTVTYTVSDDYNNSTPGTMIVYVVDTIQPVIRLNGESVITIEVGESYLELGASVTDNYDRVITPVIHNTVDITTVGTYTVNYYAADSSGNIADKVTRIVHVVDTTKPVIILNGEETIYIEYQGTYTELGANFTDNYDTEGILVIGGDTVDTSVLGTYSVVYYAIDSHGNIADEVTRTVHVVDTTKPVITLIGDEVLHVEYGESYTELGATFTDNYDTEGIMVVGGDTVDTSILGTYRVIYYAIDSHGNIADEVVRTVVVQDTTSPSVHLNPGVDTIFVGDEWIDAGIVISDNDETELTVEQNIETINSNEAGRHEIIYTVTDSSGNSTTITRIINVVEREIDIQLELKPGVDTIIKGEGWIDGGCEYTRDNETLSCEVKENNVDPNIPGVYTVVYEVTFNNQTFEKIRYVYVLETTNDNNTVAIFRKREDEII